MARCPPRPRSTRLWACPRPHAAGPRRWSAPSPDDGNRYEVIDGELFVTRRRGRCTSAPSPAWSWSSCLTCARWIYQEEPVGEYWIVDLDGRVIERWRRGDERPEVLSDRLVWLPDPRTPPFEIDLAEFFRDVLGE